MFSIHIFLQLVGLILTITSTSLFITSVIVPISVIVKGFKTEGKVKMFSNSEMEVLEGQKEEISREWMDEMIGDDF